jgi:hypothetical protein
MFSNTDGRPDVSLGRPNGQLWIQILLSCKLRTIFLEFENCLIDVCDTDNCHIKALSIFGEIISEYFEHFE